MRIGITGASASESLVSWISSTSGSARASHRSTASWRALSELTFQVAMRIGAQYRRPRCFARSKVAVSATAITAIVPAWTGSLTTRST